MHVRPASAEDADGIARVHVTAWQEAYAHLFPPEILRRLDVEVRAQRWRAMLQDEAISVYVGGTAHIEGWASVCVGHGADRPRDLELEGLYVIASTYGSGLGQALLDAALGRRPAYLWVTANNPRAWRFYLRNGFVPDGPHETKLFAGHPVEVARLVR